jgi:hypothetical protein
VRANQTHAERSNLLDQLVLKGSAGGAELGETGGDYDNGFDAGRATLFDHGEHTLGWNRDDGQLDVARGIAHGSTAA